MSTIIRLSSSSVEHWLACRAISFEKVVKEKDINLQSLLFGGNRKSALVLPLTSLPTINPDYRYERMCSSSAGGMPVEA
jgi:hypothetical protein